MDITKLKTFFLFVGFLDSHSEIRNLGIIHEAINIFPNTLLSQVMIEVAVVLPAYNEANRLERTVEKTINAIEGITNSFEIIIAEDGSTDGTDKIAQNLAKKYPFVKHLHSDVRLGRGRALKNAFNATDAEIVVYFDVDLATDLGHLRELIDAIKNGYDIATGSRLLKRSEVKRPFKRELASRIYNFLVRLLLRSKIHDHQCGFKAFKRSSVLP